MRSLLTVLFLYEASVYRRHIPLVIFLDAFHDTFPKKHQRTCHWLLADLGPVSGEMVFSGNGLSIVAAAHKHSSNRSLLGSAVRAFSVTDTGCGIPLEKQGVIFERFEKLNDFAQGTGLGLSICQLIVTHMRGRIWVDSNYTQGARFCFTHPLKYKPKTEGAVS